jgi:hypothetical protein
VISAALAPLFGDPVGDSVRVNPDRDGQHDDGDYEQQRAG